MSPTLRVIAMLATALLASCAKTSSSADPAPAAATAPSAGTATATPAHDAPQQAARAPAAPAPGGPSERRGELANPDEATMVFLYHELAGITAPLDQWVEGDSRVSFASGPDKAARREQVRAELQAGLAAVRGIGFIRLTLNDTLSEYDPTYGEFTLRSLAPSSSVTYKALQQEISLRFGNGRSAQVWAVPAAQAQGIDDSFRYGRAVTLDLLLKITGAQPAPRGGAVVADVLEYEIRTQQGSKLLARVQPTPL